MTKVRDTLEHSAGAGHRVLVLAGPFGVGKTRIAQQAARQAADNGTRVLWLTASNSSLLRCGMCFLGEEIGVDRGEMRERECSPRFVMNHLLAQSGNANGRWLLIIDDADDLSVLGSRGERQRGTGWLRQPPTQGAILITTRDAAEDAWNSTWVDVLRIPRLTRTQAAEMFRRHVSSDGKVPGHIGTKDQIDQLTTRLGHLPLAIRNVGLYFRAIRRQAVPMKEAGLPRNVADYVAALNDTARWRKMIMAPEAKSEEERDRENIVKGWEMSIQLIEREGLNCARPLLAALVASESTSIPLHKIQLQAFSQAKEYKALVSPEVFNKTVQRLGDLGMVEISGVENQRTLAIPNVIRDVVTTDPQTKRDHKRITQMARLMIEARATTSPAISP